MVSIMTGDIVNSRALPARQWLPRLKAVLKQYGKTPRQWEIYRGDSFQLETRPEQALVAALHLKATVMQYKSLGMRIAIGIGKKDYTAPRLTESNGSAFIYSGECFEQLGKQTLAIRTADKEWDEQVNIILQLASLAIENWTPKSATIVKAAIENPDANQKMLAAILGIRQGNISRGLKRAGYDEIKKMNEYYMKIIRLI